MTVSLRRLAAQSGSSGVRRGPPHRSAGGSLRPPDAEAVALRVGKMGELDGPVVDQGQEHLGAQCLGLRDGRLHVLDADVEDGPRGATERGRVPVSYTHLRAHETDSY